MAILPKYPPMECLARLRKWCAAQDRAHSDARRKLHSWGYRGEEAEAMIAELISENFLSEERYAIHFAQGKYRLKRWGWHKIESALRQKGLSAHSILSARKAFDADYEDEALLKLLLKKQRLISESDRQKRRAKLLRFGLSRGYTHEAVYKAVEEALKAESSQEP